MNTSYDASAHEPRLWRWLGAFGIGFAILFAVAAFGLGMNSEPGESASPTTLIHYYSLHRASVLASVFVIAVGMVLLAFFLSALHRALSRGDGDHLATALTIGGAVYIAGMLFSEVVELAQLDAAHDHQAVTIHVLNFLNADGWAPIVAGLSVTALATGIAALRTRSLPRWAGWVSVVEGVLALAGPLGGIAFLAAPLWILALSVALLRRAPAVEVVDLPSTSSVLSAAS